LSSASTARSTGARTRGSANGKGQPKCGDTITADTTLHKDLVDCPNNGIVIGADNITLDLNGHLIDGDGSHTPGCDDEKEFCDVGVVNERHDGVKMMHGSIRQFGGGVDVFGKVRHLRVLDISASGNAGIGIQLFKAFRSLVRDSSGNGSSDAGIGLGLYESHHVQIVHNSFRNNSENGIVVFGGARNIVERNQIRGGKDGVAVDAEAKHTLLRGNQASHARDDGFDIEGSTTKLTKNRAVRNRDLGIEAVRGVIDGGGDIARHNGDGRQCTHIKCK
jgi:parallel beta-helix repeat protein